MVVADRDNDGMLLAHRRIIDHDLVVEARLPIVHALLVEEALVNDRPA